MSDRPTRPSGGPGGPRRPGRTRPGGGFDRIKAPTRRPERPAGDVSEEPGAGGGRPQGRAALFGHSPNEPAAAVRPGAAGPAVPIAGVHCRACDATSPLDLLTVARGMVPFVVVPWADHPWWAVCPACGQRGWLRPEILGGRGGAQARLWQEPGAEG